MSVSLIVPFRGGNSERQRNWDWLRARYETLHPEWEIIVHPGAEGEWRKGTAVNPAVAQASGDVVVIADADVVIPDEALCQAIRELDDAPWVVPHRRVYRLTRKATVSLIEGKVVMKEEHVRYLRTLKRHWAPPGGGMAIMRREHFAGVDERFVGWGGEDISFARAMDTLVGPHRRLEAIMLHLWHRPMPRRSRNRASLESERLAGLYFEANGDPVAMNALMEEQQPNGVIGGGLVVASKEVIRSTPLDERFVGWGKARRTRAGA